MMSQIFIYHKTHSVKCSEYSKFQGTYIPTWRERYSGSAFPRNIVENSFF
jgi:hypothetical protein